MLASHKSIDKFWGGTNSLSKLNEFERFLNEERFGVKDLDVSYININYWDKQGILSSNQEKKGRWRNFNFVDFVWLKTIDELRQLGVSTTLIKLCKDAVFKPYNLNKDIEFFKNNPAAWEDFLLEFPASDRETLRNNKKLLEEREIESGLSIFSMSIIKAIQLDTVYKLDIFKSGYSILHPDGVFDSQEDLDRTRKESFISISLTEILKSFLIHDNNVANLVLEEFKVLQPKEIMLLTLIQKGEYDSVNIIFKDKKIKEFELSKKQKPERQLIDILKESQYQEITLKSHKGMVTSIQNVSKIKF